MSKAHLFSRGLLTAYVCLLILAAAVVVGEWKFHHVRLLSVQTGSMVPTFRPGDAIVVQTTNPHNLKVGQVVNYISPADPTVLVSHRILSIDRHTGMLITKGDHAARPDVAFSPNLVVGRVSAVVPRLGFIINFLHTRLGLIACVYMPAAFVILSEIKRLARHYGRGYYRLFSFR